MRAMIVMLAAWPTIREPWKRICIQAPILTTEEHIPAGGPGAAHYGQSLEKNVLVVSMLVDAVAIRIWE